MYGPTGVGFLWGKKEILDSMPPWKGGGEMIKEVHMDESFYADVPARFEAGTPPIAQAVGLGASRLESRLPLAWSRRRGL